MFYRLLKNWRSVTNKASAFSIAVTRFVSFFFSHLLSPSLSFFSLFLRNLVDSCALSLYIYISLTRALSCSSRGLSSAGIYLANILYASMRTNSILFVPLCCFIYMCAHNFIFSPHCYEIVPRVKACRSKLFYL